MSNTLYSATSSSASDSSPPFQEKDLADVDHGHDQELSPDAEDEERKRLRTKTACDYCRKRKTKCNGDSPCASCIYYKRDCIYTYVPKARKKRVTKQHTAPPSMKKYNPNSLQGLNNRLSALETLLTRLVTKLDTGSGPLSKDLMSLDKKGDEEETLSLASLPSSDSDSSDDQMPNQVVLNEKSVTNANKLGEMMKSERVHQHCVLNINPRQRILQWVGSHSVFHVLSAKSIRWLRTKISDDGNEELLVPIKNLPIALNNTVDATLKIWNSPETDKIYTNNLYFSRDDKNLTFELLECYYDSVHIAPFLCNLNSIRELFQVYHYAISQGDFDVINGLSLSDFLIMNVSLCLCLMNVSDKVSSEKFPVLSQKSVHELNVLKHKFFKYSIHCYEKVSVLTEGIKSVQGIGLLMLFIEASYITDVHINYMLASSLIRIARDVGIHRIDLYKYDSNESVSEMKRRLWWFCEYMDKEMCYKSGKSEIINQNDANALSEYDDYFYSVPMDPFQTNSYLKNSTTLIGNCEFYGHQYYFAYYSLMLSRIKSKSYGKLYGPRVDFMTQDQLLDALQSSNDSMFKMAKLMEPDVRPTLYYFKKSNSRSEGVRKLFKGKESTYAYYNLLLQLSFFCHLLTINRVPFMQPNFVATQRSIKFGNLSLESARTMLHLVNDFDKSMLTGSMATFVKFYPFMAFSSLIGHVIGFPKERSTHMDCTLLIKSSMYFFAHKDSRNATVESWDEARLYDGKNVMMDLMTRLFLKIVVNLMIKESDHDYYAEVEGLKEHLDACGNMHPELFKRFDGNFPSLNLSFDPAFFSSYRSNNILGSERSSGHGASTTVSDSIDTPTSSNSLRKNLLNLDVQMKGDGDGETEPQPQPQPQSQEQEKEQEQAQSVGISGTDSSIASFNFDELTEETFGSILNSQAFNLPNFFYEGNLESNSFVTNEENDFDYFIN
ncbi:hypothetical protein DFJ63DRAFT_334542 [Scheffersomyces coipomensis]|uniref:uncharacterized protein n=1 Tax=Scheffersomyces coipomensis TaxID=1788519 RepID=UPI00315D9AF1